MKEVKRIPLSLANSYVIEHHRHHGPVVGHKYSLGLYKDEALVGVAIVGRPSSRYLDDGKTLEVTRLCTTGIHNGCSQLYAACAKEAKKIGYSKVITYILESEKGTSLIASGWKLEAKKCGKPKWNTERYDNKPKQLSLFEAKIPPAEYKQRWASV